MKIFGNSSGKHIRREDDPPRMLPTDRTRQTEAPPRPAPEPPRREPEPVSRPERRSVREERPQSAVAVAERPKKSRFWLGYVIYIVVFLLIVAAGLTYLWLRMDAYERSRPYRAMDGLMALMRPEDWRRELSDDGVEASFIDTLDLNSAGYVKKLGEYSDEHPVYSIRFGKKTMLTAALEQGQPLRFGYNAWQLDSLTLVKSGLTVYAPEGALVTRNGQPVGPECLVERNAQNVTLGPLEAQRSDLPGLSKYALDACFTAEHIVVTDADGSELALSAQKGNAYYYAPMTSAYVITAPSAVTVTVNGIALTEENARIERTPLEDFAGLEAFIPEMPAELRYVIDGLVAKPLVEARFPDGSALAPAEQTDDAWVFRLEPDAEFRAAMEERILRIFDAYIAFLGNRNGDLNGNYQRYKSYLVPDSDAAKRAAKSLDSLYWVTGRDTSLDGVALGDVIRYGDNCFTAWLDFTRRLLDGGEDNNSYLFIFLRYQDEWRVVQIMNKTSFLRNG